ncbi:MAG: ferrous iron transport protein A [Ruminococcus sp.]|nr:ferrous iron transport protein A [Ruminococcus sp.]
MMPLTLVPTGESNIIKRVGGLPEARRHLESLGFVAGADVCVVSAIGGDVIINVKDSRVAISKELAQKIFV